MILRVTANGFLLDERDDFSRFHLDAANLDLTELDTVINENRAWGILDEDPHRGPHMLVRVSHLTDNYRDDPNVENRQGLAGMLNYAKSEGWIDPSGEWVRVHIENLL